MINMIRIFIIFILFSFYFSECNSDDFTIEEEYFADHLIGFYLNSIDVNTGDSSIEYFRYRIKQENLQIDELEAHYSLIINSPDLGLSNFELVSGIIDISNISISELVFSNIDINFNTQSIPGADFTVQESNLASINDLEAIQSVILSSGKIPNGTYILNVTLRCSDDDSVVYDSITKTIEAYEPVFLNLLSPGGAIQDTSTTSILNTMPLFTWNTDYCTQCNYGIRVCQYDPSLHASLSDAINDISALPSNQNLNFYPVETNGSFAYPSQDAFDLIPNNLYVWQVQREYETTLGTQEDKSEIFVFKIASFDNLLDETLDDIPYQDILEQLLGTQFDQLFDNDGELKGFTVQGNTVIINNQVVPISNLYDVIEKLNSGELQLLEIEIE